MKQRAEEEYISSADMSLVYLGLDETELARYALETAYEEQDPRLVWLKMQPIYNPLRSHPRFQDLLRRMNFPE